jgi:phosphatidylinositol glycan class B
VSAVPLSVPADLRQFERRCLVAMLILLGLSAWWSVGFHHNDEHFQILEFADLKLGVTPAADLPWEFRDRIRSWFQPALALIVTRGFHGLGVTDPFLIAAGLRLLSGLLYAAALFRLLQVSRPWFRTAAARRVAVAASCLMWFVPYLAVRFSSEGWSGSLFALGFVILIRDSQGPGRVLRALFLAGALMGLSFAARYQSVLLIGGGVVWWCWATRPHWARVASVAAGGIAVVAASLLLDRWGYGQWGLTPWRYVDQQLLVGIAAHRFGASPWWWYGPKLLLSAGPPIGLLLWSGAISTWTARPRNPLTWVTVAFVGGHCLLAHKELRFLFPVVLAAPLLIGMALDDHPDVLAWLRSSRLGRGVVGLTLALNLGGFLVRTALPARQEIGVQQAIYRQQPRRLLLVRGVDPFRIGGRPSHFYRNPGLEIANLTDVGGGVVPSMLRAPALVAWSGLALPDAALARCVIVYRSLPKWAVREPVWSRIQWAEPQAWTVARCGG